MGAAGFIGELPNRVGQSVQSRLRFHFPYQLPTMSLAKLTSLSTQTLSLLLERQRLQSLSQFQSSSSGGTASNLHLPQITRNLNQLRVGILELEAKDANRGGETVGLLRNQHGRMRGMLGEDAESLGIQR